MDRIEQKYVVIEISDEQLVMMIETDFNLMVENNAQEGIEGYIKRFEGNCIECSDYIFNKGKDNDRVIRIQEMEADLTYMKDHGEHASGCQNCEAEQGDVNVEPCASCIEFCNYKSKKVTPTDPETLDNTVAVPSSQETICGPLKKTFGKYCGPLLMNEIHNKSIEHIKTIIDYLWHDEMNHFCMGFEVEIQSQDDIQNWINVCENNNNPEKEAMTNHVFYHLMKLKKLYNL